jgi:ABC-type uncharacterized transport system auxiliary subunit
MRNAALVALTLAALTQGCSSPPEVLYFTLRAPAPPAAVEAQWPPKGGQLLSARPPGRILLERFVVDDDYNDSRIAYRRATHELGFDPYSRWAGTPGSQVEEAVRERLRTSWAFSDLHQTEPAVRGDTDFIVAGRVLRLEEVDEEDHWLAALGIELTLLDGKTREVLHVTRFESSAPAEKRNPRAVVDAMAKLLEEAVQRFIDGARPAFDRPR